VCCAQVLVYFAVAKLGDKPTDGKTDVNPEGLTAGGVEVQGGGACTSTRRSQQEWLCLPETVTR
jgi:hypothetical protein